MSKRSMLAVTVAAMVAFSAPMFVSAGEEAPKFTDSPSTWFGAKFDTAKAAASTKLGTLVDPTGEIERLSSVIDDLRLDNDNLHKQLAVEEERRYIMKDDMDKLVEAIRTIHTLAITGRLQHLVVEVPNGDTLEGIESGDATPED